MESEKKKKHPLNHHSARWAETDCFTAKHRRLINQTLSWLGTNKTLCALQPDGCLLIVLLPAATGQFHRVCFYKQIIFTYSLALKLRGHPQNKDLCVLLAYLHAKIAVDIFVDKRTLLNVGKCHREPRFFAHLLRFKVLTSWEKQLALVA